MEREFQVFHRVLVSLIPQAMNASSNSSLTCRVQSRKGAQPTSHSLADAGSSMDGGNEGQAGEHGTFPQESLGLARLIAGRKEEAVVKCCRLSRVVLGTSPHARPLDPPFIESDNLHDRLQGVAR